MCDTPFHHREQMTRFDRKVDKIFETLFYRKVVINESCDSAIFFFLLDLYLGYKLLVLMTPASADICYMWTEIILTEAKYIQEDILFQCL